MKCPNIFIDSKFVRNDMLRLLSQNDSFKGYDALMVPNDGHKYIEKTASTLFL